MFRSIALSKGTTPVIGGNGGSSFTFSKDGHSVTHIEVRTGDKESQFIQGLSVTLSDGSTSSFGSLKVKGQVSFSAQFQPNETVQSIVVYKYEHGCGGLMVVSSLGTYRLGLLLGNGTEMQFRKARLLGVFGRSGADLDSIGFYYSQDNEAFYQPRPLPEQRFHTKPGSKLHWLSDNIHRPFHVITEIALTQNAEKEVIGICAYFSSGAMQVVGHCAEEQSKTLILPDDKIIRDAIVEMSPDGFVSEMNFAHESVGSLDADVGEEGNVVHRWPNIHAHLVAIQCGWADNTVETLQLVFSAPHRRITVGRLPNVGNSGSFEITPSNRLLRSVFAFSDEEGIGQIGFSIADVGDIKFGEGATSVYSSAVFPSGYNTYVVQTTEHPDKRNVTSVQMDCERTVDGRPWTALLGTQIENGTSNKVTAHGTFVGAWAEPDPSTNLLQVGSTCICPVHHTPLCGHVEGGVFFETDRTYSLNFQRIPGSVINIRSWCNKHTKNLNGLQIERASSETGASFITDIGKLNGIMTKTALPLDLAVTEIEASVVPVNGGRLRGIRIVGTTENGECNEFLIGNLIGSVYRHEFDSKARLVGFYGTCHDNLPTSIGFVIRGYSGDLWS